MKKVQTDRTYDHEVLMQMVIELAREAADAGEMTDEVVELVCDVERVLGLVLGLEGSNN